MAKTSKKTSSNKSTPKPPKIDIPGDEQTCFIITPISNEGSEIRIKASGLIDAVVRPILRDLGFKVKGPLDLTNPGSITNQVINELVESTLVVANLTGLNPNVMYELAVRHAANLPVISLAEHGTILPFDLYSDRALFYYDSMAGGELLKPAFTKAVESALKPGDQDNPINRAVKRRLLQEASPTDFQEYVLRQLDQLVSSSTKQMIPAKPLGVTSYLRLSVSDHADLSPESVREGLKSFFPQIKRIETSQSRASLHKVGVSIEHREGPDFSNSIVNYLLAVGFIVEVLADSNAII